MKRAVVILILCTLAPTLSAQGLWYRFVDWLTEGSDVDTSYIHPRPTRLQASLDGSLQRVSVDLTADYTATCRTVDDSGHVTATAQVPALIHSSLSENINGGLGVGLSYGKLGFGAGIGTWPDNAATTRAINMGFQGHKWGIAVGYYSFRQNAAHAFTLDTTGSTQWHSYSEVQSANPCNVGRLSLDAYWSLSRSRFAYTAAYKCDLVQRRSAGSAMICTGIELSGMKHDQDDAIFMLSNFVSYYSLQGSFGAGYSHNIVITHRDPTGPKDKGLRNVTLNLTILPMLTYYSNIQAQTATGDNVTITGAPSINATGSAALGFSLGRFFISLQYRHNVFYFHSSDKMSAFTLTLDDSDIDAVSISGLFQDWRVSSVVVFNF